MIKANKFVNNETGSSRKKRERQKERRESESESEREREFNHMSGRNQIVRKL